MRKGWEYGGDDMREAGMRLRRAAYVRGMSMAALARKSGVSANSVMGYARGDAAPSVYYALAMAQALGVTVEDVWGR